MNSDPITYERDGQWCAWGVNRGRVIVGIGQTKELAIKEFQRVVKEQEAADKR